MLVVVVDVVQTAGLVSRYIHEVLEGDVENSRWMTTPRCFLRLNVAHENAKGI